MDREHPGARRGRLLRARCHGSSSGACRSGRSTLDPIHRIYEYPLGRGLGSQPGERRSTGCPPSSGWSPLFRAVVAIARAERVDLVRATDPYLMGLLAWWTSRSLGIPFCVSLHADYDKRFALTPKRGAGRVAPAAGTHDSVIRGAEGRHAAADSRAHGWMDGGGRGRTGARFASSRTASISPPFSSPVPPDVRAQFEIPGRPRRSSVSSAASPATTTRRTSRMSSNGSCAGVATSSSC